MAKVKPADFSVAILGIGAVGGFLAAVFWKNKFDVICVAKPETSDLINKQGIRFESSVFGNYTAHPRAITKLTQEPNLLFITTKAVNLPEALDRIAPELITKSIVVPLLNGLEHVKILRQYFGSHVAAGSISIEVAAETPCRVTHYSTFARVEIASDDLAQSELQKVANFLSQAGLTVKMRSSEADVLWNKLVRLNAITCAITASGQPLGFIRSDQRWRKMLEDAIKEGSAVALVESASINSTKTIMDQIDSLPASLMTSMQRDLAKGNPLELDAIAGAIVRAGTKHGISCPTIELLIKLIQEKVNQKSV